MRPEYYQDWQGPGRRLITAGEGSGLSQWKQKDGTKKGANKGVKRYLETLRVERGEKTDRGRGVRN